MSEVLKICARKKEKDEQKPAGSNLIKQRDLKLKKEQQQSKQWGKTGSGEEKNRQGVEEMRGGLGCNLSSSVRALRLS